MMFSSTCQVVDLHRHADTMNLVPVPDAETVPDTDRETQTRIPFEPCVIRGTDHIGGPEQIQPHIPILSHYYRRQRNGQ